MALLQQAQFVEQQLQLSHQELEAHKSKRLTARNEMIGLAQVGKPCRCSLLVVLLFIINVVTHACLWLGL